MTKGRVTRVEGLSGGEIRLLLDFPVTGAGGSGMRICHASAHGRLAEFVRSHGATHASVVRELNGPGMYRVVHVWGRDGQELAEVAEPTFEVVAAEPVVWGLVTWIGDVVLESCSICGAVVHEDGKGLHETWHGGE